MSSKISLLACACVVGLAACNSTLGPPATLVLSTPPDFSASVTRAYLDQGLSPEGPYSQRDVWLVIPPSTSANAGLILGKSTPVFVRTLGAVFASNASDIKAGDRIEVWHDVQVAYGAAEGPPGSPLYVNIKQVVIER